MKRATARDFGNDEWRLRETVTGSNSYVLASWTLSPPETASSNIPWVHQARCAAIRPSTRAVLAPLTADEVHAWWARGGEHRGGIVEFCNKCVVIPTDKAKARVLAEGMIPGGY